MQKDLVSKLMSQIKNLRATIWELSTDDKITIVLSYRAGYLLSVELASHFDYMQMTIKDSFWEGVPDGHKEIELLGVRIQWPIR